MKILDVVRGVIEQRIKTSQTVSGGALGSTGHICFK